MPAGRGESWTSDPVAEAANHIDNLFYCNSTGTWTASDLYVDRVLDFGQLHIVFAFRHEADSDPIA